MPIIYHDLRSAGRLRGEATWTIDMPVRFEALAADDPSRYASLFVGRRDAGDRPTRPLAGASSANDTLSGGESTGAAEIVSGDLAGYPL